MHNYSGHERNETFVKNKEFIIVITFICFVLGLMFTMQLKTVRKNSDITTNRTSDIQAQYSELKKAYDTTVKTLEEKEKVLQDYRNAESSDETMELIKQDLKNALRDTGLTDVRGPGVTIVMNDSVSDLGPDVDLNNYLVHDEDILKIVNELKSSGAEAISVNEQRIVSMSEIRCAGTTIIVNRERIAPPFTIKAIGDATMLESGINMRGGHADILKEWGIKFNITKEADVFIPKYNKSIDNKNLATVEQAVTQ